MLETLSGFAPRVAMLVMVTVWLAAPLVFGSHAVVQGRLGSLSVRWLWFLTILCLGAVVLSLLALVLLLL